MKGKAESMVSKRWGFFGGMVGAAGVETNYLFTIFGFLFSRKDFIPSFLSAYQN